MTETITVYSDYVCPFCYLGRNVLTRFLEERDDDLDFEWHPFDLRAGKRNPDGSIDTGVDDGKDEDYYDQARENVRRLQEKYGIEMAQEIRKDVDSLPAQQVSLYVKEQHPETWPAFDDAVFEALWTEGRDIGDPEVLRDLAEDVERLDADDVQLALDDDELRNRLEDLFMGARREGITGVPTFVYGEYAARGAVPPEQLQRLVEGE